MAQNIQVKEVEKLKAVWGNKPCAHNGILLKEYDLGSATGDYACKYCGTLGWGSDWNRKKDK